MTYFIAAHSYLERAKDRLRDGSKEALFHAAFELRCCVEARQNQYLDAQREYAQSIPKAWKIGQQGAALEALFASDSIQQIVVDFGGGKLWPLHYVPVNIGLRNDAKRLGELLHAQLKHRDDDDPWWTDIRSWLIEVYRMAWACCRGNLTCPARLHDGRTIGDLKIEISKADREEYLPLMQLGDQNLLHVKYLEAPPAEWICDLDS